MPVVTRSFATFNISQVDSWKERASGRNKRFAKRHAAAKLLKILRERTSRGGPVGSGAKELNEDECDDGDEFPEDENETFIPLVRLVSNHITVDLLELSLEH